MKRKRITGLTIFNHETGMWSQTALVSVMATYDPGKEKLTILGAHFKFDGEDDGAATLISILKDENGDVTHLRIPIDDYHELVRVPETNRKAA